MSIAFNLKSELKSGLLLTVSDNATSRDKQP
jgi:hypothetical protein